MRSFEIVEVREGDDGEQFEVKTKIAFTSLKSLLKYLEENPKTLWKGKDGKPRYKATAID